MPGARWLACRVLPLALGACRRESPSPQAADDPPPRAAADDPAARSAAAFTQAFYTAYTRSEGSIESLVRTRPDLFASRLLAMLQADIAASVSAPGEVVALEFDPFLNAQDVCPPYRTGQVTQRADTVVVAIHSGCTADQPAQAPVAYGELLRPDTAWVFVNIRYPPDDLLQILARLSRERGPAPASAETHGRSSRTVR